MRTRSAAIVVVVGVTAVLALWRMRSSDKGWASYLQGDPARGGRVFFDKGCGHCHAISGQGGTTAPDLGKSPERHHTLAELVGVMWNHAPQMWQKMAESGVRFPRLAERDMLDVFAFLYIARYLDESGDPERGQRLLEEKKCTQCHSLRGTGGHVAPELSKWGRFEHPIVWACAMWNHAPAMAAKMQEKGISWPQFEGNEMVDLLYYIRGATKTPRKTESDLFPADPDRGREVFEEKGCGRCHAVHGEGPDIGPDLSAPGLEPRTPIQLAGSMWNHSPEMWQTMADRHIPRPEFTEREIADLVVYLYALRYFDEPGDPATGRAVFDHKHCSRCHTAERLIGPSIERWRGRLSPVTMAYIMWLHGPKMYDRMKSMGVEWPKFEGTEMVDLIAFVNAD